MSHQKSTVVVLTRRSDHALAPAAGAAARLAREVARADGQPLVLLLPREGGADPSRAAILRAELLTAGVTSEIVDSAHGVSEQAVLSRADHVFAPRGWSGAVPDTAVRWSVGAFSPRRVRRVLVAHDLHPSGRAAVEFAGRLSRATRAELRVVHAMEQAFSGHVLRGRVDMRAEERARRARLTEALENDLASTSVGGARVHLVAGGPVDALAAISEEWAPDVLVLGRTPRTALARHLASNADELAERVACSVVSVPVSLLVRGSDRVLARFVESSTSLSA